MRSLAIDIIAAGLVAIGAWEIYQDGYTCHPLKSFGMAAAILLSNRRRRVRVVDHVDEAKSCGPPPIILTFPKRP
jgi:hypothetical protein